ncbi:nuclear transport factor 2 family protein [Maribacter algarum]|uniref:Nuclear transport factor 2 family protein n=1 Tax=Maribacter algarum (ex Zhang et al. 2020) TaxID=2578118 RepID=A0A5S3PJG0_9FLAO|nr:nuclear transport factor 2 family protein [Maribacter algarum]TMM53611.1 nuclear transport factor 2 family protein [Maribacter algarum]
MPLKKTIERFIEAVENDPHDQVIERFYTIDASIQENQNPPRIGLENLVAYERNILNKASFVSSKYQKPFFQIEDKVVILWNFKFEWKDGTISEINEIAYQKWKGEKIYQEQFYYDPKQFMPSKKN